MTKWLKSRATQGMLATGCLAAAGQKQSRKQGATSSHGVPPGASTVPAVVARRSAAGPLRGSRGAPDEQGCRRRVAQQPGVRRRSRAGSRGVPRGQTLPNQGLELLPEAAAPASRPLPAAAQARRSATLRVTPRRILQ
jgi:hypothetical protein